MMIMKVQAYDQKPAAISLVQETIIYSVQIGLFKSIKKELSGNRLTLRAPAQSSKQRFT